MEMGTEFMLKAGLWSLVALWFGCNQPSDAAQPVAKPQPSAAEPAAHEAAHDDVPKRLVAAKATAFVAYQERLIRAMQVSHAGHAAPADLTTARTETGLSEAEVAALGEINARLLTRTKGAGESVEAEVAYLLKALTTTPEAEQASQQKRLIELQKVQADVLELTEMRVKYGDAIVEAMIAQVPELRRQAGLLSGAH
jgi:hypothetical protein